MHAMDNVTDHIADTIAIAVAFLNRTPAPPVPLPPITVGLRNAASVHQDAAVVTF